MLLIETTKVGSRTTFPGRSGPGRRLRRKKTSKVTGAKSRWTVAILRTPLPMENARRDRGTNFNVALLLFQGQAVV